MQRPKSRPARHGEQGSHPRHDRPSAATEQNKLAVDQAKDLGYKFDTPQPKGIQGYTSQMKKPLIVALYLTRKRECKNGRRRHVLGGRVRRTPNKKRIIYPFKSPALSTIRLHNHFSTPGLSGKEKNKHTVSIPPSFSLIKNPNPSLQAIFRLAVVSAERKLRLVMFDHSQVTDIDLAAESILDFIALEISSESNSRKRRTMLFQGVLPTEPRLQRFFQSIGILKNLKISGSSLSEKDLNKLHFFIQLRKRCTHVYSTSRVSNKEKITKQLVDYVDGCVLANNFQLSNSGKEKLTQYTGEILDNIEEHAESVRWNVVGYLDNADKKRLCEIVIFNFGSTIAETFFELPMESWARSQVVPYVKEHSRRSFFGTNWTEENLYTLAALQGSISSKNKSSSDARGQGTVELISFFQRLHKQCNYAGETEMAILSGKTHVYFDGKYQMKKDQNGRFVIAFNKDNDLRFPPDEKYVTNLNCFFPGTAICIRFPMAKVNLERRK